MISKLSQMYLIIVIYSFSETAQIEAVKQQMSQEILDLRKEKVKLKHTASHRLQTGNVKMASAFDLRICLQVFLETQLDMEKNRVDQERKKLTLAHEQIAQLVGMYYYFKNHVCCRLLIWF